MALRALLILGCAQVVAAADPPPEDPACVRVELDPQPVWSFDGRWLEAGRALVLTDPGAGVLRLYDQRGRPVRTVARPGRGPVDFNRPNAIWPTADGLMMKDGTRFLWLDGELEPNRAYDLESEPVAPGGTVRALFDWAASDTRLYGAGDVLLPDGSWRRGLLSMELADATALRVIREIPVASRQEFDHYLMGYPMVTVLGPRGYFLALADPPAILEEDGSGTVRELGSFPPGFDSLPALPLHGGVTTGEIRYRAYESARLPVGLLGQHGRLYVLTREPAVEADGDGTRWRITRIDPDADRVEASLVLPTRSAHLSVVPGPVHWAILEKGRVERYGVQPVSSLLLLPTEWLEGESSPLGAGAPKEGLCDGP